MTKKKRRNATAGARSLTFVDAEADAITPSIAHNVDETWDGDRLEMRYEFLDSHFARPEAYMFARAYVDEIRRVTVYGPFQSRTPAAARVDAPHMERDVIAYLRRRFREVERFAQP